MAEIGALESVATVRLVDLLGEGEIEGFADGLKSVWLENTPVQNPDGSFNFPDFEATLLRGTPGQSFPRGLIYLENEPALIDAPVTQEQGPVTRAVTDTQVDRVRIILTFDSFFVQDTKEGDTDGLRKNIRITYTDGGEEDHTPVDEEIYGEELGPFEVQYEFDLQGPGPWNIRVERMSSDDDTPYEHSTFKWSRLVEIIRERFAYDGSAVVGLSFNMRTFNGKVPQRKYKVRGLKLLIPSNYNPFTREYDGIWDGEFKTAWTNNNAWVTYNLLVNEKYGMGLKLVDKWSFYRAGKYCDEMIPDGSGGTEPRYTFNGILDSEEDGLTAAQAVASSFRGSIAWTGSQITCSCDMPGEVYKTVVPTDIIDGEFFTQGVPASTSASVALVTFTDPETGDPDIEPVEDDELIDRFGYKEKTIYAMGCTSRGQARRLGLWFLDTVRHETETISYRAGWKSVDAMPGCILALADPAIAVVRNGGMVKSAPTLSQVVLDRPIALDQPTTFYMTMPTGEVVIRQAVLVGGQNTLVNFSSAMPAKPLPGSTWAAETADAKLRLARVVGMKEKSPGIFEVHTLSHDPGKYPRVEQGKTILPPDLVGGQTLTPPADLEVGRFYRLGNGGKVEAAVYAFWSKGDARIIKFEIDVRSGATWARKGSPLGQSMTFSDNSLLLNAVRVRGLDVVGRPSATVSKSIPVYDNAVTISIEEVEPRGQRRITWNYSADIRLGAVVQLRMDGTSTPFAIVPATPQELVTDLPLTGSHTLQILAAPGIDGTYMLAPLTPVVGLAVTFDRQYREGVPFVLPHLTWTAKANTVYYEVWQRRDTGAWFLVGMPSATAFDPAGLVGDEANTKWQFAIVAVGQDGARIAPETANKINFQPGFDDVAPAIPTGLYIEETVERLRRLHWTVDPSPQMLGYEIRAVIGSSTEWDAGIPLHTGVIKTAPFELRAVPAYTSAIAIRALDVNGNISLPAYAVITLSERPVENIVVKHTMQPTWPGTIAKGSVISNALVGPSNTPAMWTTASARMYSADSSKAMWAGGDYQNYDWSNTFTVGKGILTLDAEFTGPALFDYKLGTGPFVRYTSPVRIPAGDVTVRAYGPPSSAVEMKLTKLSIIIDVDDVTESFNNFAIAVSGTRLPITKNFAAILDVVATLQEGASPARLEIVDRATTVGAGPLVKVRRLSDNVDIGGTALSVLVKGYS